MSTVTSSRVSNRIPTLDGWRGIAIILVALNHVEQGALRSYVIPLRGVLGVGIFFVLSGFLITTNLMRERSSTGSISLRSFYIRRFFRLMPAAWVYLLTTTLFFAPFYSGVHGFWESTLGCIFLFRNYVDPFVHFWLTGHFWTLSIEEQFYLLWPITLLLLGSRRAAWLAGIGALAVALHRFFMADKLSWGASLATGFRVDGILVGCLAALLYPALRPYLRPWFIWPVGAAMLCCVWRYEEFVPLIESLLIVCLIYLTVSFPMSTFSRILEWKPLSAIGVLSYSLYLWQQPFLSFSGLKGYEGIPIRFLLAWAFAVLSFNWIEAPCRRWGVRLSLHVKRETTHDSDLSPMTAAPLGRE